MSVGGHSYVIERLPDVFKSEEREGVNGGYKIGFKGKVEKETIEIVFLVIFDLNCNESVKVMVVAVEL